MVRTLLIASLILAAVPLKADSSSDRGLDHWTELYPSYPRNLVSLVAGNGVFVGGSASYLIGDAGGDETIYYSDDGVNWSSERSGAGTLSLYQRFHPYNIVYLKNFFAYDRYLGTISRSTNGVSWTVVGTLPMQVASYYPLAAGNGLLAFENGPFHSTSTNGIDWTPLQTAATGYGQIWFANDRFFQSSQYRENALSESFDGLNWSESIDFPEFSHVSIQGANGTYFVFGSNPTGDIVTLVSTNLTDWETVPSLHTGMPIAYGAGHYVTLESDWSILTSTNGRDWSEIPSSAVDSSILTGAGPALTYGNGRFVVSRPPIISISTNGLDWESHSKMSHYTVPTLIAKSAHGLALLGRSPYGVLLGSTNGTDWISIPDLGASALFSDGQQFFASGSSSDQALLFRSNDGLNWSQLPTSTNQLVKSVFLDGHYVGIQAHTRLTISKNIAWVSDTVVTSTNGVDWVPVLKADDSQNEVFNDLAFGNGRWIIVGGHGGEMLYQTDPLVFSSANRKDWSPEPVEGTAPLNAIAFGNHRFVAAGKPKPQSSSNPNLRVLRIYIRHENQSEWTQSFQVDEPQVSSVTGVTYLNGRFFISKPFLGYSSADGIHWTSRQGISQAVPLGNRLYGFFTPIRGFPLHLLASDPVTPPFKVRLELGGGDPAEAGPEPANFIVHRDGDAADQIPLTVNLEWSGTAENGIDYQSISNQIVIPSGARSMPLPLTPIPDALAEGTETVTLTVLPGEAYSIDSTRATATARLLDASSGPHFRLTELQRNSNGTLHLTIDSLRGGTLVLEHSSDLNTWSEVQTITDAPPTAELDVRADSSTVEFFRIRMELEGMGSHLNY